MAVSIRWELGVAAALITLASAACGGGGDKSEEEKDGGGGASSSDASSGGSTGAAMDAGLIQIADLDDGVAGAACKADTDCKGTNASCLGGVCTGACETNKNCGAGGTCVAVIPGQPGLCSKVCTSNTDCKEGLECRQGIATGDLFTNLVGAAADAGLALDDDAGVEVRNIPKTCGMSLGTVTLPEGVVGKACSANDQCGPGECAKTINFLERTPAGYCTGKCLTDDQCGAGGVCYRDPITAFTGTDGRCLLGCSGSASVCRTGQVCRTSAIIDPEKQFCLPPAPDAGTPISDAGSASGTTDAGIDAGVHDAG